MHITVDDPALPDTGGQCCFGAAVYGPGRCTCWTAEYDLDQQPLDERIADWLAAGVQANTRARMCGDCAYRPGSPEKADPDDAAHLEEWAGATKHSFWCHQGIRRPLRWRHPSGAVIDGDPADYHPPMHGGVPWRADGQPAELCAGWAARRRALLGRTDDEPDELDGTATTNDDHHRSETP